MDRVSGSSDRMGSAISRSHLSTGKLRQEFQTLVRQMTGVPPVFTQLAGVLGDFALGGTVTLGVLAGVGAIAGIYMKLTEETRKARQEQDKLVEGLREAIHLKGLGPGGITVDQVNAAKTQAAALKVEIDRLEKIRNAPAPSGGPMIQQADTRAKEEAERRLNELYVERQGLLNTIAGGESMVAEAVKTATDQSTPKVKELTVRFGELRDAAAKVNAEIAESNRDWWKGYIERTGEAIEVTGRLEDRLIALLAKGTPLENLPGFGTAAGKPLEINIPELVAPTVESAKKINDAAKENAQFLADVISNTASMIGSIVASAINIGGGGRGSSIGGALGGTIGGGLGSFIGRQVTTAGGAYIGGALGSVVGSVIPVVGTVVGGLLGSALGGLFDHHKKAVDSNTRALDANTAVLSHLLNEPSGYKVASARYDATQVRAFRQAVRQFDSRGGAPLFGTA